MPAKALTDVQRDERIAYLIDSHDTMHSRLELVERQMAEFAVRWTKLDRHLEAQESTLTKMLNELQANTRTTRETRDMLQAWRALRGTGRVLGWFGKFVIGVSAVIAAVLGIWATLHGSKP